jgi:hypothetical protein
MFGKIGRIKMTENLRDKFALAALPALLKQRQPDDWRHACWDAYHIADECLEARDYGKVNGTAPKMMVLQGEPHE